MVAKRKKKNQKQCINKNMDSILQYSQWNIMEDKLKLYKITQMRLKNIEAKIQFRVDNNASYFYKSKKQEN